MNLLKLIPTLLNKVNKVEDSVNNIDFSSLQERDEKNNIGGYFGVTNNVYSVFYNFLNPNLTSGTPFVYNATTIGGGGTYVGNGDSTTPTLRGGAISLRVPTLKLAPSQTGSVSTALNLMSVATCISPYKIYNEQTINHSDFGSKNNTLAIILGASIRNLSSWSTADGLAFILNPLQNSGKWRVAKIIGNTPTFTNIDYTTLPNTAYRFSILYNRSIETAYFYINDILVHTMTSVNLSPTTNFASRLSLVRDDATDTSTITVGVIQNGITWDLR